MATEPKTAAAAPASTLDLKDENGEPTGITLTLGPIVDVGEDPTGRLGRAARITGWTKIELDGERYPFSKERAVALLNRFPGFDDQVKAATKGAGA